MRAFDLDERLVGVAFLDVGVYVTSLRTLKNLLLVGDAVKSVSFVAFQVCDQDLTEIQIFNCYFFSQEDPYKLSVLAKDIHRSCITSVDFFFAGDELSIVTGDEEGVVRLYEYNPTGRISVKFIFLGSLLTWIPH